LMMPERVKKMEGQIEVMQQKVMEFSEILVKIFRSLESQQQFQPDLKLRNRGDLAYMI